MNLEQGLVFNLTSSFPTCPFQYREGKKLKPKPNYNSVDLSEVEWEDRAETVSRENRRREVSVALQPAHRPAAGL